MTWSAGASPVSVRAAIIADHAADPGRVKAVYIVGHVPVPYSGDVNPDGHRTSRGRGRAMATTATWMPGPIPR
ncbi:MAG: hypothetical protein IPL52_05465 [Flavobacteriales bacterium]|nr:hypothetical protein [Flavobacteriales bacterium]